VNRKTTTSFRPAAIATVLLGLSAGAFSLWVNAGDLEPPGPPAPTMKSLREIPPTWSLSLGSSDGDAEGCNSRRFTCVLGGQAVLDNETGLVWPRHVNAFNRVTWSGGRSVCAAFFSTHAGWRLPSFNELSSLLRDLPADAPFTFLGSREARFWTMTVDANNPLRAWTVSSEPGVAPVVTRFKTDLLFHVCVRAPGALHAY
jgi:hypothetical protein